MQPCSTPCTGPCTTLSGPCQLLPACPGVEMRGASLALAPPLCACGDVYLALLRYGSLALDVIGKAVFNYEFGSVDEESPVVKARGLPSSLSLSLSLSPPSSLTDPLSLPPLAPPPLPPSGGHPHTRRGRAPRTHSGTVLEDPGCKQAHPAPRRVQHRHGPPQLGAMSGERGGRGGEMAAASTARWGRHTRDAREVPELHPRCARDRCCTS